METDVQTTIDEKHGVGFGDRIRRRMGWLLLGGVLAIGISSAAALGDTAGSHAPATLLAAADGDSFFGNLLKGYMPRANCMYQETPLIWLHVICDGVIALAYYSIPIALIVLVRRRRDVAFNWVFIFFAIFILACGAGHVLSVLAIWRPVYRLDGIVKLLTAISSVVTAIVLWPLIPRAVALPSPTELRAVNKELEAFCYSVSHDLRAPLRSLDGFSQALLEDYSGNIDPADQEHLQRIRAASQRMGRLIDDLLNLSKVTRVEMRREPVDLSILAREICDDLKRDGSQRDLELAIADGVVTSGDPNLLRIMLTNLFANAWKFTGKQPHPRIEFGCSGKSGAREYFVRDNGAGFDPAYASKLFGAFQRLHSTGDFPGTGIGLATVQRIVQRHGGRTWAEGIPDRGATFYFTL